MAFNNRIKQQFQESEKLIIAFEDGISFGFNTSEVYLIDSIGTYYPFISVSGDFGQIYSQAGGILSKDIILFWNDNFDNEMYKVSLNDGWSIKKKDGIYVLGMENE
jgi:hypothetical protein